MPPTLESIFAEAMDKPEGEARAKFLDMVCSGQPQLKKEVEALLDAYAEGAFLEPAREEPDITRELVAREEDGSEPRIGPYRLLQEIGEGGMGTVYMAEQREPIQRRVALKVIKVGMDTQQVVARFETERQTLALMDHPNIAKVLDAGSTKEGRPYFVMELVRGVPITQFCDEHSLSAKERLELFIPVCLAIQHAHQKAIIHRDIKPSNVLVTMHDDKAVPKIIDFGIAKATQSDLNAQSVVTRFEQFLGTPAYMSPEQAQMSGLDLDTRCDIYTLGVLLYELLTGSMPFESEQVLLGGFEEMCRKLREDEPPRPSSRVSTMDADSRVSVAKLRKTDPHKLGHMLRGDLDWIIMKAMEKDRTRRYETANGLAADVRRFLNSEPVAAVAPSKLYRLRKYCQRHRTAVAATVLIAFALLLGTVLSSWQAYVANWQRQRAEVAELDAVNSARVAVAKEQQAKRETRRAARLHYFASMQAIGHGWKTNDLTSVPEMLKDTGGYSWRGFEWRYWLRRMHTAQRTFVGHTDVLRYVDFSANGTLLATCGDDGTARVWNLLAPEAPPKVFEHGTFVRTVAFSPDGSKIVTAGGDRFSQQWAGAIVWATGSGEELVRIAPHASHVRGGSETNRISAACFTNDGERVVCGESEGVVRICDARTGEEVVRAKQQHSQGSFVWSVAHSPTEDLIVTAAWGDATARLWSTTSGEAVRAIPYDAAEHRNVNCVAFSPDGARVATATLGGAVEIWDLRDGGRNNVRLIGHTLPVWGVDFSADGKQLATASYDQTARLWDAESGEQTRILKGHTAGLWSVRFAPDGQGIATASWDGTAKLWDSAADEDPRKISLNPNTQAVLLPDGTVATFGHNEDLGNSADSVRRFSDRRQGAFAVSTTSGDGEWIVTGGQDKVVRVWEVSSGRCLATGNANLADLAAIAVSLDKKLVVVGCDDGSVWIWDMTRQVSREISTPYKIASIGVAPDGRWIVVAGGKKPPSIWDTATGKRVAELDALNNSIDNVVVSNQGDRIAGGGWLGHAYIWDAAEGELLCELRGHPRAQISSIRFEAGDTRVLTASFNTVRLWDSTIGHQLLELNVSSRPAPILLGDARMSEDGTRLVAVGEDSVVRIWKAATEQQVEEWGGAKAASPLR